MFFYIIIYIIDLVSYDVLLAVGSKIRIFFKSNFLFECLRFICLTYIINPDYMCLFEEAIISIHLSTNKKSLVWTYSYFEDGDFNNKKLIYFLI